MTTPDQTTTEAATRVARLGYILDEVQRHYADARAAALPAIGFGGRTNPLADDVELGSVYVPKQKHDVAIINEATTAQWMLDHGYVDQVSTVYEVAATPEQILRVLAVHAPDLVRQVHKLTDAAKAGLRERSLAVRPRQPLGPGGEPDVPGMTVTTSQPAVSFKRSPEGLGLVLADLRAGRIGLDGLPTDAGQQPAEQPEGETR